MAADALHLNLPAITTRPAIVDQQLYQPRARLDLQARQLVEFGTVVHSHVHAAVTVALADLQRFAEELEQVATAAVVVGPAICSIDRLNITQEQGGAVWSDHSLTAAFRFGGDDYDVAEAEEANLQASRTYGW